MVPFPADRYTHICSCITQMCERAHAHARTHTRTYTHTHTQTHTHTHTHTHTCMHGDARAGFRTGFTWHHVLLSGLLSLSSGSCLPIYACLCLPMPVHACPCLSMPVSLSAVSCVLRIWPNHACMHLQCNRLQKQIAETDCNRLQSSASLVYACLHTCVSIGAYVRVPRHEQSPPTNTNLTASHYP